MCTYQNPYYSYPYYSPYGTQPTPIEPLPVPSLSTTALQDIVEGQQRATTGLVTLLSQERTSSERSTRDNKQQLTNLVTLSQNFLGYLPDVEQKFSALENSIPINSTNADNAGLQDRLNDMEQAIVNLRRIAESFASSTGLRLVPVCSTASESPRNEFDLNSLLRVRRLINGVGSPRPHRHYSRTTLPSLPPSRRRRTSFPLPFPTQPDRVSSLIVILPALSIGPATLIRHPPHLPPHHG
jgi:hypothetical protein